MRKYTRFKGPVLCVLKNGYSVDPLPQLRCGTSPSPQKAALFSFDDSTLQSQTQATTDALPVTPGLFILEPGVCNLLHPKFFLIVCYQQFVPFLLLSTTPSRGGTTVSVHPGVDI